jgi:secreted Zn-dependent insulinase-like peptidase
MLCNAPCCGVQVGPDDLRRNALAGLLVQLAKRDAFNTLRTQQQLGYIVHMYGSTDLGVQVRL